VVNYDLPWNPNRPEVHARPTQRVEHALDYDDLRHPGPQYPGPGDDERRAAMCGLSLAPSCQLGNVGKPVDDAVDKRRRPDPMLVPRFRHAVLHMLDSVDRITMI
jgi:hypothetical protein